MILVSGGTGFLGSAIVEELRRRGETVAVLSRDAAKARAAFAGAVEARQADVRRPEQLQTAFDGVDVVVDAVQFPTSPIEVPRKGWTFEEVDYKGSVNQVAAAKHAGVKRYVYLSGVGAAPDGPKHWFRLKWMAEDNLQRSGLEWTIVRPTWVYGPRDRSLNRLLGMSKYLPFLPLFGDGRQAMQPLFIDDLARVVADACRSQACANQLFELGGPEVMSMNDVLRTALAVMGRKRPILHAPMLLGKALGSVAQLLPTPPLTADALDFISRPAVADNSAVMRLLNPRLTPLREGLATYLRR